MTITAIGIDPGFRFTGFAVIIGTPLNYVLACHDVMENTPDHSQEAYLDEVAQLRLELAHNAGVSEQDRRLLGVRGRAVELGAGFVVEE